MSEIAFTVRHEEARLRGLYRTAWRRVYGTSAGVAFGLAVAFASWWLMMPSARVVATAGVVLCAGYVALLQHGRDAVQKRAVGALRRAGSPEFAYRATAARLVETSALGHVELPWTRFCGTREVAGYLLLLLAPEDDHVFVALPLEQLPDGARRLLEERVSTSG